MDFYLRNRDQQIVIIITVNTHICQTHGIHIFSEKNNANTCQDDDNDDQPSSVVKDDGRVDQVGNVFRTLL